MRGAPCRKGEGIVRSECDRLNIVIDSAESGCLRMCPRYLIRASEIRMDDGIQEGRIGYDNERRYSLEHGESVGERTR